MTICVYIVIFRALHEMSVWFAAQNTANAVEQHCKVQSCPSEYILIFWCKGHKNGHYVLSRVWNHPLLRRVR